MILCKIKVFRFVKKVFFVGLIILSSFTNKNSLNANKFNGIPSSCISMNNQPCKARAEIINVSSNSPVFYPFSIKANKCNGNCNHINNPYAKIYVPDVVKDFIKR